MALFLVNQFIVQFAAEKRLHSDTTFTAKILDVRHKFTIFLFR